MFKIFRAGIALAIALLVCVYGVYLGSAQDLKLVIPARFGPLAQIICFNLPEDQQGPLCWIFNDLTNTVGFYHADGVGPSASWPEPDFSRFGVSDTGRDAIIVTTHSVKVYTLLRRERRLAGISTPRVRYHEEYDDEPISASIAGGNLIVLFTDRMEVSELPLESQFVHLAYLPMVSASMPNSGPTPVVAWPTDYPCQGLSSDPPWCANRTPEPPPGGPRDTPEPWPTPAVATARP